MPNLTERELFLLTLDLPDAAAVETLLLAKCPQDTALRERVLELYRSAQLSEQILPDVPTGQGMDWAASEERAGEILGHYELQRIIGQGGFGVVWLARQERPIRRDVAIKILKIGMDTQAVVARFERERQALAMMDHPNVARIFDAGSTASGRPYFVMDLLVGVPLLKYVSDHLLPLSKRVSLIQQAALALQHAHQKGIIHRDIKPSNLLVVMDENGQPLVKVIDFGVAKLVEDHEGHMTLAGQRWGTPAYMSPEQLAGAPGDTRTDIFALGLVMYELLSGIPPQRQTTEGGETTLTPPSHALKALPANRQITQQLRGDLDWIVLKCAAPEASRRYESAGALWDDLQRYLAGDPVTAGPPTLRYRTGKFIRRNRGKLILATVASLLLLASSVVSFIYARRAAAAQHEMTEALYEARLTEGSALRQTGRPGQRLKALEALQAAATIHPTAEVRAEALAAMALPDLELLASLDVVPQKNAIAEYDFASDLLFVGSIGSQTLERYYLRTGEHLPPMKLPSYISGFNKLRLAPGGKHAAGFAHAAGQVGGLFLLETETGLVHGIVMGADADREPACFFDGGKRIAVGAMDGGLLLCDASTGVVQRKLPQTNRVTQISADDINRRLLVLQEGKPSAMLVPYDDTLPPLAIASPPAGTRGMLTADGRLGVIGSHSGALGFFDPSGILAGDPPSFEVRAAHSDLVNSIYALGGGRYVISSSWDRSVRLIAPHGGLELTTDGRVLGKSSDGSLACLVQGNNISLVRFIPADECPAVTDFVKFNKRQVTFSPDGKSVAISSTVGPKGTGGTLIFRFPELTPVERLGSNHAASIFVDHGSRLITVGSQSVSAWDVKPQETLVSPMPHRTENTAVTPGNCQCLAVSGDGNWLAAAVGQDLEDEKKRIHLYRQNTMEPGPVIAYPPRNLAVSCMVLEPSGKWLISSYWKGAGFDIWDVATGKLIVNRYAESESVNLTLSADATQLVTTTSSEMKFWSTNDWTCLRTLALPVYTTFAHPISWSPDGSRIACEGDRGTVRLTDARTDELLAILTLPQRESVDNLEWAPDGRTLAVSTPQQSFFYDLRKVCAHLQRLGIPSRGIESPDKVQKP